MAMTMTMELEALAINYLTQSVWAWLAFLTAALSFWKIKSSIHHNNDNISPKLLSPSPPPPPPPPPSPSPPLQTSNQQQTTFCLLENRRNGKYSVYYGEDAYIGRKESRKTIRRHNNNNNNNNNNPDGLGDEWEALLKLKTMEMGWYRYQDLTLLDGIVVRFWNHHLVC
ncbi:uncharacterized protein LOC143572071 [Bidens hawaiensis]|uniref:uncharacterized protein LOC143572071 n=1 Tax=Bidens hawaiensis TaxID=980011 RepID=UPI004049F51B